MFVRGCSVECWLWDSHLGFHWDFIGVVVCGVCFAFWLSVGGFVRLLWCGFVGVLYWLCGDGHMVFHWGFD